MNHIGNLCDVFGWELSCIVAFEPNVHFITRVGLEREFLKRSETLSKIVPDHEKILKDKNLLGEKEANHSNHTNK